jgi:hypothetical protein
MPLTGMEASRVVRCFTLHNLSKIEESPRELCFWFAESLVNN